VESNGIERIDFIKCDVDGYEAQVLNGAMKVLRHYSPKVLVEIDEHNVPEVAGFLKDQGYDSGVFRKRGKCYPASETGNVAYRHPEAKTRMFLFRKR